MRVKIALSAMGPDDIFRLYDAHAPRLYALALRMTGSETAAAEVLEEVFAAEPVPDDLAGLVRATREKSLERENRTSGRSVVSDGGVATPRLLVEEAFFHGRSVADLAKTFSVDEKTVRVMLRNGLDELRELKS
jgi:DNA-directed RNA polymerase specialized sigma24 family protein